MEMVESFAYKKSKIGEIPEDWLVLKIGQLSNVTAGGTPKTTNSSYWDGDIPWMNSGELNLKHVNDVEGRITEKGLKNSGTKLLPENCVLIGLAGQGKTRGTVAMNLIPLCTNQSIAAIHPSKEVDQLYLFHNLNHRYNELRRLSTGDGGRGGLNLKIIKDMWMPMPPEKEQQKIAKILSTWDQAIEKTQQQIEQLELRKKGLMQELLTGKKRLPGFDGEWKELKAGDIFDNHSNKNHNGEHEVLSATQNKGVIPRNEVGIDIKYDKNSLKNYKKVDVGDFVISLRSFQGGIEYSAYEGLVSPAYTVLKEKLPISKRFYAGYLKTVNFINRLNSVIYGIRDGKQISYKEFSSIRIWYPPYDEQKAISKLIILADEEIKNYRHYFNHLKYQKKGLMQELLTGKKRVKI